MTRFRITNAASGLCLGEFEASNTADALNALARDAGYEDHADACAVIGGGDEILVEET